MDPPFPTLAGAVLQAIELLQIVRPGDLDEMAGDLNDLSRPWEPAACPDDLCGAFWGWCDDVAQRINHEYASVPTHCPPT